MSKSEPIPPLPPRCKWERTHGEHLGWRWSHPDRTDSIWEEDIDDSVSRRLIACWMRCAWLDEAVLQRKKKRAAKLITDEYSSCIKNAEAWRKWGEERP